MLRKISGTLLIAALCLTPGIAAAEIAWHQEPFDQLLKTAKAQDKPIFIDFYTTWCGPCKMLDAKTYPDAAVEKLLNSMLPAKYDAEKEPWIALAKTYKIHAYPTLLIIGPDGKEVGREIGYLPPKDFVDEIGGLAKGAGTVATLEEKLKANPDDFDLLVTLGTKHAEAGHADRATELLKKAMALDPKNEKGRYPEILYTLGEANYNADRWAAAKTYFTRLTAEYPGSDVYRDGMARLAKTQFKLGDADAAVATYWTITKDRQDDDKALNAFAWFCSQAKIGLDKALPAAEKAARLSNRDPGILDTLAEVHFAMGNYDKAIEVETEAAGKQPDDKYFKDQIEKYRKAKADADHAAN